jgi:uncharacterized membrane protein
MMEQPVIEYIVFYFFFFSFSGWVGETIMESLVRGHFVNKGFFKGPYVPVHGVGGFVVYALLVPLKAYPLLVYIAGVLLTSAVEYLAALLLEKAFNKKCWDYDTYPFTKWCNYKKRIALTTSLFFGLVVLAVVYFYWDFCGQIVKIIGPSLLVRIDIFLLFIFTIDMAYTFTKYIRNNIAGIPNKIDGLE